MKKPLISSSLFFRALYSCLFLLILSALLTSCESRRVIVNSLDEKEANEILVYLSTKGVDANKVATATEGAGGGNRAALWNISVESSQANEAMALLNQVGLPRRRGQNLLGIFSNVGLVPSGMQEKVRYQAGLAEQIASTIRKIDGVLDADVQISFPDEDPLNPNASKQNITASVYVKHSGVLDDPNAHLATRIKRLVAGSINGLNYDNVTVIGDRARFSEIPTGGFLGGSDEEKSYVNIWSIILARESVTRFRTIFFTFTIALATLLISLIWLIWKLLPLLKLISFKELFTLHAIQPEEIGLKLNPESKEEVKEAPPEIKDNSSDQGVDET
jgi:type III secretion protein J